MFDDTDDPVGRAVAGEDDGVTDDAYADEYEDDEAAFADEGGDDAVADDLDEPVAVGNGRIDSPKDSLSNLVYFLATNLVDDPESVVVEAEQRGQTVSITLRVPEEELGKVIGRQGRIARAIRTVLMIAGSRQNVRASLDIEG